MCDQSLWTRFLARGRRRARGAVGRGLGHAVVIRAGEGFVGVVTVVVRAADGDLLATRAGLRGNVLEVLHLLGDDPPEVLDETEAHRRGLDGEGAEGLRQDRNDIGHAHADRERKRRKCHRTLLRGGVASCFEWTIAPARIDEYYKNVTPRWQSRRPATPACPGDRAGDTRGLTRQRLPRRRRAGSSRPLAVGRRCHA